MRKLAEEVSDEGLESLVGKRIAVWCLNYIYAGKLIGVNDSDILLTEAKVVYETGILNGDSWKDAQSLPHDWYIRVRAIESYGEVGHA